MSIPGEMLCLLRVYGAMCSSSAFPHSLIPRSDSSQWQQDLVNNILMLPHLQEYPPSREFRRHFWKWIVTTLESRDEEVDERIYQAYLEILSVPTSTITSRPPSPSYNTHFWSPSLKESDFLQVTTLLESRTMIEGGTTGLRTWGASLRLADWLITHPEIVRGHRILELGSGAGFLGLVMAALQLEQCHSGNTPGLVLTDANSEVLSRCRDNFMLPCNGMGAHPSLDFRLLDWSDALTGAGDIDSLTAMTDTLKTVDILIGADLVYDATIVPALVAVLALFFRVKSSKGEAQEGSGLTAAYIALTIRREDTVSSFLKCLSSRCLKYEEYDLAVGNRSQFLGAAEVGTEDNVKLLRVST